MRNRTLTLVMMCLFLLMGSPLHAQQTLSDSPTIAILKVSGKIDFGRKEWTNRQPLIAGTLVMPTDLIYPQNATLLVMCPDGSIMEFLPSDLLPNSTISCPTRSPMIGDPGSKRLVIRRGGRQDSSIPYLIAPRATVVRKRPVEIRWNAVLDAQSYMITVRGGGNTWTFNNLTPDQIVQDTTAHLTFDKPLRQKTAYSVEICVVYADTIKRCTSDPDWSTSENLAFFYAPTPQLDKAEAQLIDNLGEDGPETLYARAVLLSQPIYPADKPALGVYHEAIAFLEQIIKTNPKSALAASPSLYNLLGELYRDVSLPLNAAQAYERAANLAKPGTETAARAALGRAMTTSDSEKAVALYNQVLDEYAAFLSKPAYISRVSELCKQIGDMRFDVARCQSA